MSESGLWFYGLLVFGPLLYFYKRLVPGKLSHPNIPAIGSTDPFLSFFSALYCLTHYKEVVQRGYDQYKGGSFKVPEPFGWHVIVTGGRLIEELRKARDDELSFGEAVAESLQVEYTLGPTIHTNGYHIPIIRGTLTRNLGVLFPQVRDELAVAFHDIIPTTEDWVKVPALKTIMKIVCRTTNRVFVGLPLCRNEDYRELNVEFTVDVIKAAVMINMFPKFLRDLAGRILTPVPSKIRRAAKHLRPLIEERNRMKEEYGDDWADKPNDLLMWLMDEAIPEEQTVDMLARRILTVNFAAIHTTSMSFAHALYQLAAHPEFAGPLREEIERVIKPEGWTKQAMQKMRRLDSFMKESQRFYGLGATSMSRLAMQDYTFSDGTFIPKGSKVSIPATATHYDDKHYANAGEFDPWRFAEIREEDGEGTKHQMVSTSTEYVPFGHGRHACPGRFFATNELKAMMAHIVMNYDVKLEKEGEIPPASWVASAIVPNPTANVLFRKRR